MSDGSKWVHFKSTQMAPTQQMSFSSCLWRLPVTLKLPAALGEAFVRLLVLPFQLRTGLRNVSRASTGSPLQLQHLDKICQTRLSVRACTSTQHQSLWGEKCHACFGCWSGFRQPGVWGDKYKSWMIPLRSLTSANPTHTSLCSSYSYITYISKVWH